MKLVQLNIFQGKMLLAVSRFLQQQDADIVTLQEVFSCKEPKTFALLDLLNSLETLQETLQYPYVYFEPTSTFDVTGVEVSFGCAILSKFPVKDQQAVFTNGEFYQITNWPVDYIPNVRNAIICTIETPGGDVRLATHHGFLEGDKMGTENTIPKMQKLADSLKDASIPVILAGDLNVVSESQAMRVFDGWLEDLTATHNLTDTLTEFGKVRDVPCDHILVSKEVTVRSFEKSPALVSDHSPLVMEFDL